MMWNVIIINIKRRWRIYNWNLAIAILFQIALSNSHMTIIKNMKDFESSWLRSLLYVRWGMILKIHNRVSADMG